MSSNDENLKIHNIIITGGRDERITKLRCEWLVEQLSIWAEFPPEGADGIGYQLFVGDSRGIDSDAEIFAEEFGIPVRKFYADWVRYGLAAGPIRNKEILAAAGNSAIVIVFPGSKGTADMTRIAIAGGYTVVEYVHSDEYEIE